MKALDVSRALLSRISIEEYEQTNQSIDNLKMQKLLFYAQKISFNFNGKVLFNDEIQAWSYGPVVPNIYHEYKKYHKKDIDIFEELETWENNISYEHNLILDYVMSEYNIYSGSKLISITHNEPSWKDIINYTIKDQTIEIETLKDEQTKIDFDLYINTINNIWKISSYTHHV